MVLMIKFTHKNTYKENVAVKQGTRMKTGLQSLLPTNAPAQRLLVSTVLALSLLVISLFFISFSHSKEHPTEIGISDRLTRLIWPSPSKQNVNNSVVNLPGAQFLPSLSSPLNILVMGVDSNGRNTQRFVATRSDTMMLVSIDPQKNKAAIISIPRDSRVVIANGHGTDKINAAHAFGGPQLAMETVRQAFNVPVDRYLVVDEEGFRRIFEEFGPIDVLIEKKMSYSDHSAALSINLEPGLQSLDAKQVEGYIRFRHDARGDIGRIERQQWFARQMANKITDPQIIVKLPQLFKIASDCIVTDLSVDEMMRLVGFAGRLSPSSLKMAMLPGTPGMFHGISYWLPEPAATTALLSKLVNSDLRPGQVSDPYVQPEAGLGSAMAYTPVSSSSPTASSLISNTYTVAIRYPQGCEKEADSLELLLKRAGLISKGKYKAELADCQHEQIVENSVRALAIDLESMRNQLPCLNNWPAVVNIDSMSNNDLTLVITPNSKFASLASAGKSTSTLQ